MRSSFWVFFIILVVVALGQSANGLQNDLIALKAVALSFPTVAIGAMMAMYYAGFTVAAFSGHHIIGRQGHVRSICLCLFLSAIIVLAHYMWKSPVVWACLRFATGFTISLFSIGIESWINEQAQSAKRGRIFSLYMTVQVIAITAAQYVLSLGTPDRIGLFVVSALLFVLGSFAILPAKRQAPCMTPPHPLSLHRLFSVSRFGACAALLAGFSWSVIFMFGPVYAQQSGLSLAGIGLFMGGAMGAGAVMQIPAGWLSDHFDRKKIITLLFLGGIAASVFGLVAPHYGRNTILIAAVICGGFSFPVYAVAAACINDAILPKERVSAAAGVLMLFGMGSIAGPLACGWAMHHIGAGGYYTVLLAATFVGTILGVRMRS